MISDIISKIDSYIEKEGYKGYDPYDTLNSPFIPESLGNIIPVLAIQVQKRNPINIRPLLKIKKEINPKAIGLFLHAYSRLYKLTGDQKYLQKADYLFDWLINNYSTGYSGMAWGYNFPWAGPGKYLQRFTPTSVVTGFVSRGIFEYYLVTGKIEAKDALISSCNFLEKDILCSNYKTGICFSYTPIKADNCYNASLLTAEIFAKTYSITGNLKYKDSAINALNYVLQKQKNDGSWFYSINEDTGEERKQIDFHQGYILMSASDIIKYTEIENPEAEAKIKKGIEFYINSQFFSTGQSLWRYPKKYPVDIHNQAQGIITLSYLNKYQNSSKDFAQKIADWTIENMFDKKGYFYFRKNRIFKNRIPYMRWSQAWMFLALTYLIEE